ncbi:MAG: hypothetical protein EAZ97_16570 [Bacteroidetes bacterium]|nr:MAG: hypothetical protein EAZ97_16570 [Bacteroidota bacterium]
MYAIIDIETSGGSYQNERITEIAILVFDGKKVVDQYQTLINPERILAPYITQLTGITNEMLADAPKFYEVAKKIFQMTEGNIFVAHNVSFDYWFVKSEFKRLGSNFNRKTLCTVKLSRKIIPKLPSYSLGKLCETLGIKIKNRHRAMGDAEATVQLFELLLEKKPDLITQNNEFNISGLHANLNRSVIDELPEEEGVYHFFDENGQLIYIGKSKNIQQRVRSHFYSAKTKKAIEMKNLIADISYELTGNELIALLQESVEIKKSKPLFNRAQRRSGKNYGIFLSENENGYVCLSLEKTSLKTQPIFVFESPDKAKQYLFRITEKHQLCQKLTGLYKTQDSCFHYKIKQCLGACIGEEKTEIYNARVQQAIESFDLKERSFLIVDKGREKHEKSVIWVENGIYLGFGYVNIEEGAELEDLKNAVVSQEDNQEVRQLIKTYLRNHKVEKIIEL